MKKNLFPLVYYIFVLLLLPGCTAKEESTIKSGGHEVIAFRVLPFDLTDVSILDGPFLHATELNSKILLGYEPDRLLAKFRSEAGLEPRALNYGGWENESLAGHSLGHYLSGCSMMYQTTGDQRFLERVIYIVDELRLVQEADGSGYLGAFPDGKKVFEEEVAKGNIRSAGFDLNGIWSPFYTHHKVLAGLRDAYRLCGNGTALEVEKRFADWIETIVTPLNDEQLQKMLHCEFGGIGETLADLYADTNDEKYLRLSRLFYHKAILDPLRNREDILPGKHANTIIPKLIAQARLYELAGDSSDRKTAEFFWNTVTQYHSYVTGGNGNDEYFGPSGKLRNRLGEGTTESCNVYNMLKLTEHLFEWEASANSADFYESALFNHILSTQNPEDGHVVYNLSLAMGGLKDFQDPEWFTCCIGTGMENHSKYGRNIYYHNENELFIFQYIASELRWPDKGLTLTQNTGYPEEQGTSLEFKCENPLKLTMQIRYPYWAENGIEIKINEKKTRINSVPGSFIPVTRRWETGDRVEISIPFSLRLESMPDDSARVAVMYGPLVMAGDLGAVKDTVPRDIMYVPVMMTENRDPAAWMKPVDGKINTFTTVSTGRPRDVTLRPFYTFHDRRYSVYWDLFTEEGWQKRQEEYLADLAEQKRIMEATIDFVQPGEMQPERNHNFKGERTTPYRFNERPCRESRGGWFSFDMKTGGEKAIALAVDYWGGFPGAKTFDILVNDKIIATENISNKKDGQFITVQYDIPEELLAGRSKITVRFMAQPGNTAGPVFGVRTIFR